MATDQGTVIVTGSSGFIGRAVCTALLQHGYTVVGFDRPGAGQPPDGIAPIACDVTSDPSVAEAVGQVAQLFGTSLTSVIHLAAYYDFSGEPSPLYDAVTVEGTARLLRRFRRMRLEQFVFSSTMLVHAPCEPGQRINEEWPVDPHWDYPASKARAELVTRDERDAVPVVLARLAGVYTDEGESVPLAHQIQRIYERRLTARVFPGNTAAGQSFVHLDDAVAALLAMVVRRKHLPEEAVFLIGEPDPLSYDTLQRTLGRLIHGEFDWRTLEIPKGVASTGAWVQDQIPGIEEPFIKPWMIDRADDHYALDISRARRLLGWSPRHTLRDTLPRIVAALQRDPDGFYRLNKLEGAPPHRETTAPGTIDARHRDI